MLGGNQLAEVDGERPLREAMERLAGLAELGQESLDHLAGGILGCAQGAGKPKIPVQPWG